MSRAVKTLQRQLGAKDDGTFGPVTAGLLWAAAIAGRLPDVALLEAARDELGCVSHLVVSGVRVPVPQPLWVRMYRFGELDSRPRLDRPVQIILHHDGGPSAAACFDALRARKLGSPFCVDDPGILFQFADPGKVVMNHAGGHVRRGNVDVETGFNRYSIGLDFSNPADPTTGAGKRELARGLEDPDGPGPLPNWLALYPCQVEAGVVTIRTLRACFPTIPRTYRLDPHWRGDIEPTTPGVYGHRQISKTKSDPSGFPFARLAEV